MRKSSKVRFAGKTHQATREGDVGTIKGAYSRCGYDRTSGTGYPIYVDYHTPISCQRCGELIAVNGYIGNE